MYCRGSPVQNSTKSHKARNYTIKRKLNWCRPESNGDTLYPERHSFVALNLVSEIVKFSFLEVYIFVILIGREFQVGVSNTQSPTFTCSKHGGTHVPYTDRKHNPRKISCLPLSLPHFGWGGEKTHFLLHKSCITPTFLKWLENM